VFGTAYPHVHKWIDGTYDGANTYTHWINRHHLKAIKEKFHTRDEYREREAAKLHVLVDWLFRYNVIKVPRTGSEVILLLREHGVFVR